MASNVKMHSLIEGNSMSGVDTFKSMVSNIFKVCPISLGIALHLHVHTAVMQASRFWECHADVHMSIKHFADLLICCTLTHLTPNE